MPIPRLKLTAEVRPMLVGRDAEAAKITSFLDDLLEARELSSRAERNRQNEQLRQGRAVATRLGMTVLSAFPVESEIP